MKDYTWDPIDNLYCQEELVETYEKWLKADNERLDIEERERKIAKRLTAENLQNAAAEKCRKDDTLSKKPRGSKTLVKEHSTSTWQMMRQKHETMETAVTVL